MREGVQRSMQGVVAEDEAVGAGGGQREELGLEQRSDAVEGLPGYALAGIEAADRVVVDAVHQ